MESRPWQSAAISHVGNVRKINEDSLLDRSQQGLWVVADGMGGHSAGDVASQLIVKELGALHLQGGISARVEMLENTLLAVNQELLNIAQGGEAHRVIGSTAVALLIDEHGAAVCAWVGDSRLYRLRDNSIEQLTQDHSQVEEMIGRGEIQRDEAESHPAANVITRAVGGDSRLFIDMEWVDLAKHDRYLLCSDGLYKELSDLEIGSILQHSGTSEQAANALIAQALDRGSRDNVSVIVIDMLDIGSGGKTAAHAV